MHKMHYMQNTLRSCYAGSEIKLLNKAAQPAFLREAMKSFKFMARVRIMIKFIICMTCVQCIICILRIVSIGNVDMEKDGTH